VKELNSSEIFWLPRQLLGSRLPYKKQQNSIRSKNKTYGGSRGLEYRLGLLV
jgi:hypothetical protein